MLSSSRHLNLNVVVDGMNGAQDGLFGSFPIVKSAATAAAVTALGALAFYAMNRVGADASLIVDPDQLQGLAATGQQSADAVVRGMSQITRVISDTAGFNEGMATIADLKAELAYRGVDPEVLTRAVERYSQASGEVKQASRVLQEDTRLTGSVQSFLVQAIWHHDKRVAMQEFASNNVLATVGKSVMFTGALLASTAVAKSELLRKASDFILDQAGFIKAQAIQVAVDNGLISPKDERDTKHRIARTGFIAEEARARTAAEYAARDNPTHRSFVSAWMRTCESGDQKTMLQLFGLERQALGRHTEVGRAVMIDHFDSVTLRSIAKSDPQFEDRLIEMSERRAALESKGLRPAPIAKISAETGHATNYRIVELIDESVRAAKQSSKPSVRARQLAPA